MRFLLMFLLYNLNIASVMLNNNLSIRNTAKEFVYVVSGTPNFGSHSKHWYKWAILDVIKFTAHQFAGQNSKFSVVWGGAWRKTRVITPLTDDLELLEQMVQGWLLNVPTPCATALSGLAGTVEFSLEHLYTEDVNSTKIMVVLTHWNMLHSDVKDFLRQECTKIITYIMVFPSPHQVCELPKVRRVMLFLNNWLNRTELLQNNMAICGRWIYVLEEFNSHIYSAIENNKRIIEYCDSIMTSNNATSLYFLFHNDSFLHPVLILIGGLFLLLIGTIYIVVLVRRCRKSLFSFNIASTSKEANGLTVSTVSCGLTLHSENFSNISHGIVRCNQIKKKYRKSSHVGKAAVGVDYGKQVRRHSISPLQKVGQGSLLSPRNQARKDRRLSISPSCEKKEKKKEVKAFHLSNSNLKIQKWRTVIAYHR